jgi:hypothetical protein
LIEVIVDDWVSGVDVKEPVQPAIDNAPKNNRLNTALRPMELSRFLMPKRLWKCG